MFEFEAVQLHHGLLRSPATSFLSPHTNLWLLVASTHSNVLEQWSCTCFLYVALAFMAVIYACAARHNCGKP